MIIRIPYEWAVAILGEQLAPYFNDICATITLIGFLFYLCRPRKTQRVIRKNTDTRPIYIDQDEAGNYVYTGQDKNQNTEEPPIREMYFGQYDRYSDLTDEEMKLAMKIRIERKEPTYEEWKAAREAEKHPD